MNIDKIKKYINEIKNNKLKIKVYIGRNKYEYYEGYIDKIYPNIFTINTPNGKKAYSYSDVAIKNVILTKFS